MIRGPADDVKRVAFICRNLDGQEPPQRATKK
jgi:hypothetical protein